MKDPRTTFSSSEWSMILASYDVTVGSTTEPEVAVVDLIRISIWQPMPM